jgi:hypothetical protein
LDPASEYAFTGHSAASNVILKASAKSKMLANSWFLLFAALFDLHLPFIINVLSSTVPRERVLFGEILHTAK